MADRRPSFRWLERTKHVIARVEDGLLAGLLTLMLALAVAQIALRNFWETGLVWGDPLTKVLVLWVALLGAMVAARQHNHINIDVLSRFLPAPLKAASEALCSLFAAAVCGVVAYHAAELVLLDREAGTLAFAAVPTWVSELIIPIGFGIIGLRYLLLAFADLAALLGRRGS